LRVLTDSSEQWLLTENCEITPRGNAVIDRETGLRYLHEFPVLDLGEQHSPRFIIDRSRLADHLTVARSKFSYLQRKTVDAIKNAVMPVLVRDVGDGGRDEVRTELDVVRGLFSSLNPRLRFVVTSTAIDDEATDDGLFFRVQPSSRWQGDDPSWERVFIAAAAHWN
jgi:hypothetical protein